MEALFDSVIHRSKVHGAEIDVFLPALKIGIEIDGAHWHKDNYDQDRAKSLMLQKHGIKLIRLREQPLNKVMAHDILHEVVYPNSQNVQKLCVRLVKSLLEIALLDEESKLKLNDYLESGRLWKALRCREWVMV